MSSSTVTFRNNAKERFQFMKTKPNNLRPEFERQLFDTTLLVKELTHEQLCLLLKELITICKFSQIQTLWTSFQPLLHRDYMFMGQKVAPNSDLTPISTEISRNIRSHLTRTRAISRFHRVQSAHISNEAEVRALNKLPPVVFDGSIVASQKKWRAVRVKRIKKKKNNVFGIEPKDHTQERISEFIGWFKSWSNPEKTILFRHFLTILSPKQIYFVCSLLSVKQNNDIVTRLPRELALKVLSYLSPEELTISSSVSKEWHDLCLSNDIWQEKCDQVRAEISTPNDLRLYKYYDTYRKNEKRKQNWKNANCIHTHLKGHSKKVLSVAINGKTLISGGADAAIKIWDIETQILLKTLTGHTKGVWSLAVFTSKLIVSGSHDATVKVWNVEQGRCLRTMYGHSGSVWAMGCKKHLLVTGSHDKLIKLWDLKKCCLIKTFKGHGSAVFAVDLSDDAKFAFSGSADHSARIWNLAAGRCQRIIWTSNSSPVMSVSSSGDYFVYTAGTYLTLWNICDDVGVKTYRGHKCRIENAKLRVKEKATGLEVSVLTGGRDGRVRHWTITNNEHNVKTMDVHPHQVNCITFDKRRIIAALCDNTICVCDFTAVEESVISREST